MASRKHFFNTTAVADLVEAIDFKPDGEGTIISHYRLSLATDITFVFVVLML